MDPVRLVGTLAPIATLDGYLTIPERADIDYYRGDYTVTPRAFNEVILATRGKAMIDDVTVLEIPYWETSNPYGKTFIIGE